MKKLLLMAGVAAMAFGAQAGDTYSEQTYAYAITLDDIKLADMGKVKSVKCYLIDISKDGYTGSGAASGAVFDSKTSVTAAWDDKAVMADFTLGELKSDKTDSNKVYFTYDYSTYKDSTGEVVTRTSNLDCTTSSTYKKGSEESLSAETLTFRTDGEDIKWNNIGRTQEAVDEYAKNNLKAILVADTTENGVLEIVVNVTCANDKKSLGSSATYTEIVPEPTSGMLVFLGLAGLMLKRKRAA